MVASRILLVIAAALVASFTQAFTPAPISFVGKVSVCESSTSLEACRTNAKKEKRIRNRDNMRKFQQRGSSRKKTVKKQLAGAMRQLENEFIAKCFITIPPPDTDSNNGGRRGR